ncbi:MAG: FG-GAP-like repeat-containing protein [Calditrichia bacterium]
MMNRFYRRLLGGFSLIFIGFMLSQAQLISGDNDFRLGAVNPLASTADTLTSDAGRGIWVAHDPDLDNDGLPEIIVTDYQMGGRVFVYEVVGNDKLEFVWASPVIDSTRAGGGLSPRSVTTGDFDNDGNQEIVVPIGLSASDSAEAATRGLYFYEFTGNDNDYGTEPAYRLTYEAIDSAFALLNQGTVENGIRVQDIDHDGKSELLYPPRQTTVFNAKLYILQVSSGTFENKDVVIDHEYTYEGMVQPAIIKPDSYVPCGTEIGDVDNDGLDEIIVAGWTSIASGAGLGFIQINGPDSYTDGSVIKLSDFSAFIVKSKPLFTKINGEPVIFVQGTNSSTLESQMWIVSDILLDELATSDNVTPLFSDLGYWSAWALGDQDHPTDDPGDGVDLYLSGGARMYDIEYAGSGDVTSTSNYTVKQIYNLSQIYDNMDGLFNDVYAEPGMDLDKDGLRDFVAAYKGSPIDTLAGISLAKNGLHIYFFEWGDSTQSINLSDWMTGIQAKEAKIITPDDYRLEQNYPNPFNPTTTIEFSLPLSKTISLKIYNTLGQEVRTLINNQKYAPGDHLAEWDSRDNYGHPVASGVYIYRLTFGNFSKSGRMTLIR